MICSADSFICKFFLDWISLMRSFIPAHFMPEDFVSVYLCDLKKNSIFKKCIDLRLKVNGLGVITSQ